jgi:RNA polymerase sigma-70 factor (ECF subfamily)
MAEVVCRMNAEEIARELLARRLDLTAYLRSLVCNRDDAEDLFQDLCVKAVARAAEFQSAEHLRRWFFTAGRNAAIDAHRQAQRHPLVLSEAAVAALAADEPERPAIGWRERLHALRRCLETLTPRAREIVQLRYGAGLDGRAVSHRSGRSLDAVYKILARSYEYLRECIRRREALDNRLP